MKDGPEDKKSWVKSSACRACVWLGRGIVNSSRGWSNPVASPKGWGGIVARKCTTQKGSAGQRVRLRSHTPCQKDPWHQTVSLQHHNVLHQCVMWDKFLSSVVTLICWLSGKVDTTASCGVHKTEYIKAIICCMIKWKFCGNLIVLLICWQYTIVILSTVPLIRWGRNCPTFGCFMTTGIGICNRD